MRIRITTKVEGEPETIFNRFSRELFLKLNPPGLKVELLRFDGCNLDGETHVLLVFPFKKFLWISRNTSFFRSREEIYFIDEGVMLPPFLKSWKHKHLIRRSGSGTSKIIDDIQFKAPAFLTLFLYPVLYLQFYYRKRVYQAFFSGKTGN